MAKIRINVLAEGGEEHGELLETTIITENEMETFRSRDDTMEALWESVYSEFKKLRAREGG